MPFEGPANDATRRQMRQTVWLAVRDLAATDHGEGFSVAEIVAACGLSRSRCYRLLAGWAATGAVALVHRGQFPQTRRNRCSRWQLVTDAREAPAVRRDGQPTVRHGLALDHMWRAMKILGKGWTATELALAATTDEVSVSPRTARAYARALLRAGYLVKDPRSDHPIRYRLPRDRNTGPLPPVPHGERSVYDANLGRVVEAEQANPRQVTNPKHLPRRHRAAWRGTLASGDSGNGGSTR